MEVSEGAFGNPECMGEFIDKVDYVIDPAAVIPPLSGQNRLASHRCNDLGRKAPAFMLHFGEGILKSIQCRLFDTDGKKIGFGFV